MLKFDKIILSSKKLYAKREEVRRILQKESIIIPAATPKLVFPKFSFNKKNLYVRAFPWRYNGFLIYLENDVLVIDPGVDFLSRCFASNINVMQPNIIFISHAHLDHHAGANSVIETMMTQSKDKKIMVLASPNVFKQRVLSGWHINRDGKGIKNVETVRLSRVKKVNLGKIDLLPIPLVHTIPGTFGFILKYKDITIGYISDTGYTKTFKTTTNKIYQSGDTYEGEVTNIVEKHIYIKKFFKDVDYLICNINDFRFTKHSKTHLSGYDIIDIIKDSSIKKCIIAHLNQFDLTDNNYSKELEDTIQHATGIKTETVKVDGLSLDLH